jgi:metacaspase-1
MPKAVSLHIGVNQVDKKKYCYLAPLLGAVQDASFMEEFAKKKKFSSSLLTDAAATRDAVTGYITSIAEELQPGDTFLLSFSGHGGRFIQIDTGTNKDEKDGYDDTWCLYDEQLLDDELNFLFTKFSPRVKIIIVSDSCHSGTIFKAFLGGTVKAVDESIQARIQKENLALYKERKRQAYTSTPVTAGVLLLAACKETEQALDLGFNGAYTNALKISMGNNTADSYKTLNDELYRNMQQNGFRQTPQLKFSGNRTVFENHFLFKK